MKQGAYDYLTKPFKVDEIDASIEPRAREAGPGRGQPRRCATRSPAAARLAHLLGKSRAMQQVFELIGKIHSTRTSRC